MNKRMLIANTSHLNIAVDNILLQIVTFWKLNYNDVYTLYSYAAFEKGSYFIQKILFANSFEVFGRINIYQLQIKL